MPRKPRVILMHLAERTCSGLLRQKEPLNETGLSSIVSRRCLDLLIRSIRRASLKGSAPERIPQTIALPVRAGDCVVDKLERRFERDAGPRPGDPPDVLRHAIRQLRRGVARLESVSLD